MMLVACTVDGTDGATSLGDPTYGTTATTTVGTTATTTTPGSESDSGSSSGEEDAEASSAGSTAPDSEASSDAESAGSSDGGVDEQPADGMYSACVIGNECFGVQGCVTVMPQVGFCTNGNCTDASSCDASPGGTATPACVTATLNAVETQVCALDCSGGKTCPGGMECLPLGSSMVCA